MIVRKKICSFCGDLVVLWKANPKACKDCWAKHKGSYVAPSKPSKKIKSISNNRLKDLSEYRYVRDNYLGEHKVCENPNCSNPSEDLHHAKGRVGGLLTDVRYFKALCRRCHRWVEDNPEEAKALGLSLSRLEKD